MSGLSPEYLAQSRVTDVYFGYSIPIPLEIISTGLRLWAELYVHKHGLVFDDYLMIAATVVALGQCSSGLALAAPNGIGRHEEAIPAEDNRRLQIAQYVMAHFYQVAIALTKLSVLALYYRAFQSKTFHKIILATAAVVTAWLLATETVLVWICQPIAMFWEDAGGFCYNMCAFGFTKNLINLSLDLWIFMLPMPLIVQMRMPKQKKILLALLFCVGLATCGISAARIPFNKLDCPTDGSWFLTPLTIFSMYEPLGGILCANVPAIYKPLGMVICKAFGWSTAVFDGPSLDQELPSWLHFKHAVQGKRNPKWEISTADDILSGTGDMPCNGCDAVTGKGDSNSISATSTSTGAGEQTKSYVQGATAL
ncbi:uncharacterized protein BDV17DRAFT_288363 [Aspergillus undulatus]|uniref:uncharacterized protein n=1 Tax=Aspergillus undulatus TaxID=1810928 RepID=UPI003CCDD177